MNAPKSGITGGGYSVAKMMNEKKETEIQEQYSSIEKTYLEKKSGFDLASQQAEQAKPSKETNSKTKEMKPLKNPEVPKAVAASGNLDQDYGPAVKGFTDVVEAHPGSKAAKMAALNLSEIYMQYKNNEQALQVLKKVDTGSKDLLGAMVQTQIASLQADQGDCKDAVETWQKVLNNKDTRFMHSGIYLKQGLCFEVLNDVPKAEASYSKAKELAEAGGRGGPQGGQGQSSAVAQTADKYLRLLQTKKN